MIEIMEVLVYLGVGTIAGLLAGLLGIGGGFIVVPTLIWMWQFHELSEAFTIHLAIGTAHATIIITTISSVYAHHRRQAVLWPVFRRLTVGVTLGALAGVVVASALPGDMLRKVYAIFALLIATQMIFAPKSAPHSDLPRAPGMLTAGGVVGIISAIIGIGGGSMVVAFLTWCSVNIRQAVGTASACGLPIAVASTVGFVVTGWNQPGLPSWSIGYVYLPALAAIVIASMTFAPLGARLAHALPTPVLKKGFAGFLLFVGSKMLIA